MKFPGQLRPVGSHPDRFFYSYMEKTRKSIRENPDFRFLLVQIR